MWSMHVDVNIVIVINLNLKIKDKYKMVDFVSEYNGVKIEWELTGNKLNQIDEYDWSEVVLGYDENDNEYEGTATVSIGDIIKVEDIEKVN